MNDAALSRRVLCCIPVKKGTGGGVELRVGGLEEWWSGQVEGRGMERWWDIEAEGCGSGRMVIWRVERVDKRSRAVTSEERFF